MADTSLEKKRPKSVRGAVFSVQETILRDTKVKLKQNKAQNMYSKNVEMDHTASRSQFTQFFFGFSSYFLQYQTNKTILGNLQRAGKAKPTSRSACTGRRHQRTHCLAEGTVGACGTSPVRAAVSAVGAVSAVL